MNVCAEIDLSQIAEFANAAWRVGLSAVVETLDGAKTYWALAHPAERPDFHHPDSFVCELSP